jgi:hypothetical protein
MTNKVTPSDTNNNQLQIPPTSSWRGRVVAFIMTSGGLGFVAAGLAVASCLFPPLGVALGVSVLALAIIGGVGTLAAAAGLGYLAYRDRKEVPYLVFDQTPSPETTPVAVAAKKKSSLLSRFLFSDTKELAPPKKTIRPEDLTTDQLNQFCALRDRLDALHQEVRGDTREWRSLSKQLGTSDLSPESFEKIDRGITDLEARASASKKPSHLMPPTVPQSPRSVDSLRPPLK